LNENYKGFFLAGKFVRENIRGFFGGDKMGYLGSENELN
jgi:hypothetical protein